MKKHYSPSLFISMLFTMSCLFSCKNDKNAATTEEVPKKEDTAAIVEVPKDNDSTQMALLAPAGIIIEDTKVMLQRGTGIDNCTCANGTWSSSTTLSTVNASVALPSFNFSGVKPRAVVMGEVTFPNVANKGLFKLSFDKGCNVLKFVACGSSTIAVDKKSVKVSKNNATVNVKPDYDLANTGKFTLTPTNCNGCKFRYKRCTGSWQWVDCAPQ